MDRGAIAVWRGNGSNGKGMISTDTGALQERRYSARSSFEQTGQDPIIGTNPEELLGAAHAACFSMALSHGLAQAGTPADRLDVKATSTFVPGTGITQMRLELRGRVPGLDAEQFRQAAEQAKENCPVSKALAGNVEISLDASLES